MLKFTDANELLELVEKAVDYLSERGYEDDFYLDSIVWDDEESYWIVGFYCETSNIDYRTIVVKRNANGYRATGEVFDLKLEYLSVKSL